MLARKLICSTALLLATTATGWAQTPPPRKVYTNKQLFNVPLKIEDADRAALQSLKFYAKVGDRPWGLVETGTPQTTRFTYQAAADGEYWFGFGTVNLAGKETPESPDREQPRLIVVVDTKAPEVSAVSLPVASGQTYIQGTMRDANADPTTLTGEFEASANEWKPLVPLDRDTHGIYRMPERGLPLKVRISGRDKAGNAATQEVTIDAGGAIAPVPVLSPPPTTPSVAVGVMPVPPPLPPIEAAPTPPRPVAPEIIAPVVQTPTIMPPEPRIAEKPPAVEPTITAGVRTTINTQRCELNYALDGFGAAPVVRVEAYGTRDEGKTWIRLGEDPDCKSPFPLALPEDGVYGIVLVVSTAGQPAAPPTAGETPDWCVEVDTKSPEVRLDHAALGTGDDAGIVNLRWSVRDANLKPDAVEVAWAHLPDGPWLPIAAGLRAEGQYRWPVPRTAGSRVYLRIEAADRAGNVGRYITPQPIAVEAIKPRARVLGINPSAVKP